jgi:hypothetical protein
MLAAVLGVSCSPKSVPDVLTVEQLVPRIDELNGRRVSVFGYLSGCGVYDCTLYRNKADSDAWDRFMIAANENRRVPMPDPPVLGIGTGGRNFEFDAMAAPFQNGYVVISGTVTNQCRYQGQPSCTDRSPDLNPTAIRRGRPPAP